MNPFLSIITATYNSEKTLEATIVSVLNQNYTNFEYILIDGKSTDNTIHIIQKYEPLFKEKNISYRWISEKDFGIYNAWNKGLKLATGNWISFLGSDDIYLENALEKYANIAKQYIDVDFIHSKIKIYNDKLFVREITNNWNWKKFKKSMNIAHVGAFHNSNYFKKYGYFNEVYKIAGDYELLLRATDKLKTNYLDAYTVIMNEGGISSKMFYKAFKESKMAKINSGGVSLMYAEFYNILLFVRLMGGSLLRKLKIR